MNDKVKFAKTIAGLSEIYERDISEHTIDIYWNVFKNYSDEEFDRGIRRLLKDRTLQKFPKPAEIIKYIEQRTESDIKQLEDRAEVAWQLVRKAMSDYGAWRSVVFEDKTIMGVIEAIGGWRDLCVVPIDQLTWKQKEFCRLYRIDKMQDIDRGVESLIGHFELINNETGREVSAPKLVKEHTTKKQIAGTR